MRILLALLVGAPSATAERVEDIDARAAAVRDRTLPKVQAGNATLAKAQTVKAACTQLGDMPCTRDAYVYIRMLKAAAVPAD